MRARLSYLALILIPLLIYGAVLANDYGTPADFLRLFPTTEAASVGHATDGILQSSLLDVSFGFAESVVGLRGVRALGLMLLVLCGIALWQVLERGGWSEFDAAAAALSVLLLPAAQLSAGWATAWPGTLAALLALAGFAAVESELEMGGRRRFVAVLGGWLLYVGATMCFFPGLLMALVPLAGVALVRVPRVWATVRGWFLSHVAVLVAALFTGWGIERAMQHGAGLTAGSFFERVGDVVLVAVPTSFAPFIVADGGESRLLSAGLALIVAAAMAFGVRRLAAVEERQKQLWLLVAPTLLAVILIGLLLSPTGRISYRETWPSAGVVMVAALALVRGLTERPGQRPFWHYAAMAGIVALGVVAASGQVYALVVRPLAAEWHALEQTALRVKSTGPTAVRLALVRGDDVASRGASFGAEIGSDGATAKAAFAAALRDRFPSEMPKSASVDVQVLPPNEPAPTGAVLHRFGAPRP